jgi:hypothetical protein
MYYLSGPIPGSGIIMLRLQCQCYSRMIGARLVIPVSTSDLTSDLKEVHTPSASPDLSTIRGKKRRWGLFLDANATRTHDKYRLRDKSRKET